MQPHWSFTNLLKPWVRPMILLLKEMRKLPLFQIFLIFSSESYLRSKTLNRYNIQKVRISLAEYALLYRRRSLRYYCIGLSDNVIIDMHDSLSTSGLVKSENVLPAEIFDRAKSIEAGILNNEVPFKEFVKAGAEYREIVVSDYDSELSSYLCNDFWAGKIARTYLAKSRLTQQWRIKLVRDYNNDFDRNTQWHCDTFFSTLKAFIYLNDVQKEQDVFEYLKCSHLMDESMYRLHCKYARDECRQPWPTDAEISSLKFDKFSEDILANTLILADTRGLHRRHPKSFSNSGWRATLFCSYRCSPFKS